jgi:3-oxoacyl-[acyl-carrier protein] reductase
MAEAKTPVSSDRDFSGRTVIVTGAARGMGLAVCEVLAAAGADVAPVDVLALDDAVAAIEGQGRSAYPRQIDASDRDAVLVGVADVARQAGSLDVLVTCAAITGATPELTAGMDSLTPEDVDRVLAVNLKGAMWFIQAALPYLRESGGNIVCIGSAAAKMGGLFSSAHYVASKGGVHSLIKWVARHGAAHAVRANAIAPGFVDTDMTRGFPRAPGTTALVGREGHVADIAYAVRFLASDQAAFITGTVLDVNGGALMD